MFKTKIMKLWLAIILLAGIFSFQKTLAIEYGSLGGKPANPDPNIENSSSWFIYNLAPGEAKEDALLVMNLFEQEEKVLIYAADTTRSSSGGFALKQFTEPKEDVGAWVRFYPDAPPEKFKDIFAAKNGKIVDFCALTRENIQEEFDKEKKKFSLEDFSAKDKWCEGVTSIEKNLSSKEKSTIPFVISIPQNVDVGEHTGGILIQKIGAEDTTTSEGTAVKLTTRVGVRIYETVPGEVIRKLTLEDFRVIKNFKEFSFSDWFGEFKKPQEYLVQSKIKNEGNVSVEHQNIIRIKDLLFGERSQNLEDRRFQVLKHDVFTSNYAWNNPRFGRFSFQTEIVYKNSNGVEVREISPEIKIWIIPWREIVLALIIILLALAGWWGWKKYQKKRYGGVGWVEYKVQKGENINSLSEKFKVEWKVLAKTNKLKAPYLLEEGRIILVPPVEGMEISKIENKEETLPEDEGESSDIDANGKNRILLQIKDLVKNKKFWIGLSIIILIIIIILLGLKVISMNKKMVEISQKISITSPSASPSTNQTVVSENKNTEATRQPEEQKESKKPNQAEISIKVLNGGAAPGMAGKIKDILIAAGYVKTEALNAEEKNHKGEIIYYGESFQSTAEEIKVILSQNYPDMEIKEAQSAEQKSADVVIIIGK